jgi:tRNA (guanine37-N1)-methyltransferase
MNIHVISIFPEMFSAITDHGVIARAIKQNVLNVTLHNPRDYALDKHSTVDGRPYGGGPGMVMMPEVMTKVIEAAIFAVKANAVGKSKVVYLSPQGRRFNHDAAKDFALQSGVNSLILIAGRYEGIDERVLSRYIDEEWSVGDYVLSGGELPAMIMIDAIARLLPSSLGNSESAEQDSFADGLLDCPHYTRPENFDGDSVPQVLMSGDHQAIERWRLKQSLGRTWLRRPDLLVNKNLTSDEMQLLNEFKLENTE